jgi:serine/threonine-protein kinase HipA
LPLDNRSAAFVFPNLPQATFDRMPGLLADALPDAFGNALIDAWMARHGMTKNQVTPLDRLAYMGSGEWGRWSLSPREAPIRKARLLSK